jgi:hypothetical protein
VDVGNGTNVLGKFSDSALGSIDALKEVLLAQWFGARLLESI